MLEYLFSAAQVGNLFSDRYCQSEAKFTGNARRLTKYPMRQREWALEIDSKLATKTVWIGNADAQSVIVIISGTHGVEGFCGSAVQSFLLNCLEKGALELDHSVAILMIHALNPWGMENARRCDQSGIDINRNFIDFDQMPEPDSGYLRLLEMLSMNGAEQRRKIFRQANTDMGESEFDRVFSGGQYHCPWGPFYGGINPSTASDVIDEMIDYWQLEGAALIVLDLHSGLGPWAYGELISDHPDGSQGSIYAQHIFGQAVASTEAGNSFSVPKNGLLDYRWHQLMNNSGCFVTLEFGTKGTENLFNVLIDDHLFWRDFHKKKTEEGSQLRQRMLDHFCPDDPLWQQAVLFKAWQVVDRAIKGVI